MTPEELMKAGIANNVIIYDTYSQPDEFTPRLVALIKSWAYSKWYDIVNKVYTPLQSTIIMPTMIVPKAYRKHNDEFDLYSELPLNNIRMLNVELQYSAIDLTNLYLNLDGSIPSTKRNVVAGLTENSNVILGAY